MGISQARPQALFQVTVLAGSRSQVEEMPWLVQNHQQFNLVTLMLYGASMEGFGWGVPCENPRTGPTYDFIRRWRDSGIPVNKMVLGMTTTGLQGHMVDFYKELVLEEGWAGITFWNWVGLSGATEVNEACILNPAQRCSTVCSPPSGTTTVPPPSGTTTVQPNEGCFQIADRVCPGQGPSWPALICEPDEATCNAGLLFVGQTVFYNCNGC